MTPLGGNLGSEDPLKSAFATLATLATLALGACASKPAHSIYDVRVVGDREEVRTCRALGRAEGRVPVERGYEDPEAPRKLAMDSMIADAVAHGADTVVVLSVTETRTHVIVRGEAFLCLQ